MANISNNQGNSLTDLGVNGLSAPTPKNNTTMDAFNTVQEVVNIAAHNSSTISFGPPLPSQRHGSSQNMENQPPQSSSSDWGRPATPASNNWQHEQLNVQSNGWQHDQANVQQNDWESRNKLSENVTGARTLANIESSQEAIQNAAAQVVYGYNTMKNMSLSKAGEMAIQTIANQYKDTDAKKGVNEMKRETNLVGGAFVSGVVGTANKSKVYNDFYNNASIGRMSFSPMQTRLSREYSQMINKDMALDLFADSINAQRLDTISGNISTDFIMQKNRVVKNLEDRGINARNMSSNELRLVLSRGKIKDKTLDDDTKKTLHELLNLKGMEGSLGKMGSVGAGFKSQMRVWGTEAVGDSDTYKGYKTVETGVKAGFTAYKIGRGAVGATGIAGAATSSAVANAVTKIGGRVANTQFKKTGDVRWKVYADNFNKANIKITDSSRNVKATFRDFKKQGMKGVVKNHTKLGSAMNNARSKFLNTGLIRRINNFRVGVNSSIATRILKSPFKILSSIFGGFKTILIAIGITFVALIGMWYLFLTFLMCFPTWLIDTAEALEAIIDFAEGIF